MRLSAIRIVYSSSHAHFFLLLFFALVSVFFAAAVFFFEEFVLCAIDSDPFSAQKIAVRMMESTPTTQQ